MISPDERKLLKNDIVICITKDFTHFTYGHKYKLYADYFASGILPIMNDIGDKHLPSYYGGGKFYFVTPDIWRDMQLNELIDEWC